MQCLRGNFPVKGGPDLREDHRPTGARKSGGGGRKRGGDFLSGGAHGGREKIMTVEDSPCIESRETLAGGGLEG